MTDERLQSILHVSDLHFGDNVAGTRDARIPRFIQLTAWLEGFLGHHWRALEDLDDFVWHLCQDDDKAALVVSGDLTVNGSQSQFDLAKDYLGPRTPRSHFGVALGFRAWLQRAVPGNHDRWPGSNVIFGGPTAAFHATFPGPYPIITAVPLASGITLRFIFLDTDQEVGAYAIDRFLARGRFRTQVGELKSRLGAKPTNEIRILVQHHSIQDLADGVPPQRAAYPRKPRLGVPRRFEIEPGTLELLEQALVENEIQVVLSGHLHVARLTTLEASFGSKRRDVFDARCGTTTQLDRLPADIVAKLPPGRKPPAANTLILHELWRRDKRLVWEAQIYRRQRASGFVADGARQSFDLT